MSHFFNRRWRPAIIAFFVAMFCIVHVRSVYGQPLFSPGTPIFTFGSSLESAVADSDLVVRAVIEDVSKHQYKQGLYKGRGRDTRTISVRVLETLKGVPTDNLRFVKIDLPKRLNFETAMVQKQQVILFLKSWTRIRPFEPGLGDYALARFPLSAERPLTGSGIIVLDSNGAYWDRREKIPIRSQSGDGSVNSLSDPNLITQTIKQYVSSLKPGVPVPEMRVVERTTDQEGFIYDVRTTFPARTNPKPILSFEEFKTKHATQPDELWTRQRNYYRKGGGVSDSVELMAIDCDIIARVVIKDICTVGRSQAVNLKILETLKGACDKEIGVFVNSVDWPEQLEELKDNQSEVVVFFHRDKFSQPASSLGYRARGSRWDQAAIVLDNEKANAVFSDLTWHREPREIMAQIRIAVQRDQKRRKKVAGKAPYGQYGTRPPVFKFYSPASLWQNSPIDERNERLPESKRAFELGNVINLPVDAELEANAKKWALSKNRDLRWVAARAMLYFKSDQNAAILRTMLSDVAVWSKEEVKKLIRNLRFGHNPQHLVRWEAWHVLAAWGEQVPKVEFREATPEE